MSPCHLCGRERMVETEEIGELRAEVDRLRAVLARISGLLCQAEAITTSESTSIKAVKAATVIEGGES